MLTGKYDKLSGRVVREEVDHSNSAHEVSLGQHSGSEWFWCEGVGEQETCRDTTGG